MPQKDITGGAVGGEKRTHTIPFVIMPEKEGAFLRALPTFTSN